MSNAFFFFLAVAGVFKGRSLLSWEAKGRENQWEINLVMMYRRHEEWAGRRGSCLWCSSLVRSNCVN